MSGYIHDLDERQRIALDRFRQAVDDIRRPEHTDANLLRWLRAREFDIDRAESMFRQHMRWRQVNNVDNLVTEYEAPKVVREHFPGGILNCCPNGNPLWLINIGCVDIKGFLQVVPQTDLYRHCMYLLENQEHMKKEMSRKLGRPIETQYVVMDFEHFSVRQLYSWQVIGLLTDLLKMYEANFPESLEKAFVINVPSFFPILWKILSPLLTQRTVDKVGIFGKEGWKESLLQCMDASRLPLHWGGTLTGPDGDPRCPHLVCPGGEVPDEYRDQLAAKKLWGREGVQKRSVERRGRFELPLRVEEVGSRLRWSFQTAKGDLAFGVRFEPFKVAAGGVAAGEQVLEMHRVPSCSLVPEHGSLVCSRPGTYVLQFDNSYSWVTSKEVAYEVHVEQPPPPAS